MIENLTGRRLTTLLLGIAFGAVILQIVDKSLNASLFVSYEFPRMEIIIFGVMTILCIAIELLLFYWGKKLAMIERGRSLFASIFYRSIIILQGFLCILLISIFIQTLFQSEYSIVLLELSVGTSLLVSSLILAVLSARFLRTMRYVRNRVVLAYMIATAFLCLNSIISFIYIDHFLIRKPEVIASNYNSWSSFSPTLPESINILYQLIGIISFVTFWIATLLLTRHYSAKIKIRYWLLVSIPLVYFASQFFISYVEDLNPLRVFRIENTSVYSYLYNLFLNTVRIVGGILFGFAFFAIARGIGHLQLKRSIILAGVGLIILAGVNSTLTIIMTNFPPWGILSISFSIAGSFCLMIGLDSAAFYIAADSSLRRFTKGCQAAALSYSNLLVLLKFKI
jgi:MFS family permease